MCDVNYKISQYLWSFELTHFDLLHLCKMTAVLPASLAHLNNIIFLTTPVTLYVALTTVSVTQGR